MNLIGTLADDIRSYPDLKREVEPMMKEHILAEISSSVPYLQMRAIWFYGEFDSAHFEYQDKDHVFNLINSIYLCLEHPCTAVRFMAASTIHKLLKNNEAA